MKIPKEKSENMAGCIDETDRLDPDKIEQATIKGFALGLMAKDGEEIKLEEEDD